MKKSIFASLVLIGAFALGWFVIGRNAAKTIPTPESVSNPPLLPGAKKATKVTINEAARTLLYLPLYYADDKGFFRDAHLEVNIITGGTATNSVAAMLSGEADFAQADPMYAPISREKGSDVKVIAQVVGRIAVWGVSFDSAVKQLTADNLRRKSVATHPRPMTAYTYTAQYLRDAGLDPERDVTLITSTPGTEIAAFLSRQADYMISVEPNISRAVTQGAHVVLSFPQIYGDQVLTGLMAKESYLKENRNTAIAVVHAYQRALVEIRANPASAAVSAAKYFPQLPESILLMAIQRMAADDVLPHSVVISEDSWKKAMAIRVAAGDLKAASPRDANCDVSVMNEAAKE